MKNQEICFCCLKTPASKRDLSQFRVAERRLYVEITGSEIALEIKAKICNSCRKKLKSSAEFVKLCKESYASQVNVVSIEEIAASSEIIITVCEQNDSFDEDDDIPFSIIQDQQRHQQQQLEAEGSSQVIEVLEIEKINETAAAVEEEAPIKEKRFKCQECQKSFSTNQKLQHHSYIHSGIKDWPCDSKGCEKKFATEARLKAHCSE
jgi:hypothetical protein